MKHLYIKLSILLFVQFGFSQIMEITHQSNGTVLQLPIESIDSVRINNSSSQTILKTVYQNNGNILGLAIQDIDSITYHIPTITSLPVLSTTAVSQLTSNSVWSGGNVSSDGGSAITQRGVCWNTVQNPTIANNFTTDGIGIGEFSSNILPLNPSTTYYIRAYAVNENGTSYGNEIIFTTPDSDQNFDLPIVTTGDIIYNDGLEAIGSGLVSINNGTILSRGLCWAVGVTPTINSSYSIDGSGVGGFASFLDNLLPDTIYRVRAYATSEAGVAYGEEVLFKTHDFASYFKIIPNFLNTNSASLELAVLFDGNSDIIERGVCWSLNNNPTIEDNYVTAGSGEGYFYKTISNLSPGTSYYFRPYATNGIGTSYGPTIVIQTSNSYNIDDLYAMMYEPMGVTGSRHYDFGQKGVDIFTDMVSGDMALSQSVYGWYNNTADLIVTVDATRDENKIISKYYINIIHAANTFIEGLTPFGAIPTDNEERWLLGQALAMRAHSYFYLTQCFQEEFDLSETILPLFDGNQYVDTPVQTAIIYNLIENDLQTAISLLNGFNRSAKKQIDQNVARMILAYALAAKADNWQEVASLTNDVIATTSYTMLQSDQVTVVPENDVNNSFNFVDTNSWVWGVDITEEDGLGLVSWWGQIDAYSYSYAAAGDYKAIDTDLYTAIPDNDARKGQFVNTPFDARHLQPLYKFAASGTIFGVSQTVTADYVYMRVEEAYLLNAEANAKAGNTAAARTSLKALLDLRVPSSAYVDILEGQDLLDEIYLQNRIELWGEGKSYLAMKRNQATVTRGANHVYRSGESFVHNTDELTFEFNIGSNESYTPPALDFLDCENMTITNNTPLVLNEQVSDFTFQIPYVTGNGGDYESADFISSGDGVEGLTASIDAGTFNLYEGVLEFNVTGIPLNYGTAIFNINIGGRYCQIELDVLATQNCESYETILSINFDANPEESYWELYSVSDPSNPLFSGGSNGEYTGLTSKLIPFCLDAGDYVLSFFDTNNNGMTYGNYSLYDTQGNLYVCSSSFTNQQISQFTAGVDSNLQQLTLEIQFDSYPEELYWWIEDASGNSVANPGTYSSYNNPYAGLTGSITEQICLPEGTYTFYIYDDFGDGAGPITLTGPNGVIYYSSAGDYGSVDSVEFTL